GGDPYRTRSARCADRQTPAGYRAVDECNSEGAGKRRPDALAAESEQSARAELVYHAGRRTHAVWLRRRLRAGVRADAGAAGYGGARPADQSAAALRLRPESVSVQARWLRRAAAVYAGADPIE